MWKIILHSPMFMNSPTFEINVEEEPTADDAEMARSKLMAKSYEIVELKDSESTEQTQAE